MHHSGRFSGWRYRGEDLSQVRRATGRQIGQALLVALPAVALPFVIRAAVVYGVDVSMSCRLLCNGRT